MMMNKNNLLALVLAFFLLNIGCSPDCETYVGVNSSIDAAFKMPGAEVLIKTTPITFLADENREIFLQERSSTSAVPSLISSTFVDNMGRIATIPESVTGDFQLYYEDKDCGGFIPLSELSVRESSFFIDNPSFVTPFPPQIIIPVIQPPVPPVVINAWFSVNNPEYCIWFGPERDTIKDEMGNFIYDAAGKFTFIEKPALIKGDLTTFRGTNNPNSLELSAGCNGTTEDDFFHGNSVTGIVDKDRNIIRIQIDRTSKGLGIEGYEGEFIDVNDLPQQYRSSSPCGKSDQSKTSFMLLTSTKTGHQLLLFRN